MNKGGGTCLTLNGTLVPCTALLLDLSLKVLMGLDALITPFEPTAIDVIMVDVLIVHECLKLVSKKNSMSEWDNSVECGN